MCLLKFTKMKPRIFLTLTLFVLGFSNCKDEDFLLRTIRLTEIGSGQPISGASIVLYQATHNPQYPDKDTYQEIKTLGVTDANGILQWQYDAAELPAQPAIGFLKDGYYHVGYLENLQQDTLEGQLYPHAYVRFHLTLSPGAQQGSFWVHDPSQAGNQQDFWEGGVLGATPVNGMTDTTVLVKGAFAHVFNVYVYEPPALPTTSTLYFASRSVFCPAHDTVLVEIVF